MLCFKWDVVTASKSNTSTSHFFLQIVSSYQVPGSYVRRQRKSSGIFDRLGNLYYSLWKYCLQKNLSAQGI